MNLSRSELERERERERERCIKKCIKCLTVTDTYFLGLLRSINVQFFCFLNLVTDAF